MKLFELILCATIIFSGIISCEGKIEDKHEKSECEEIIEVIEDCMGLHRGALKYIDSCGTITLKNISAYNTCDELLEHVGL